MLSGLIGDRLERNGSALHQPASARMHGERIGLDEPSLRDAFPQATPRLAIFIHGLTGDEFCWSWGQNLATNPADNAAYGSRLVTDLGYTPIYLRYNSGLHISENGRAVAALLEAAQAWPLDVRQIALVGHSMGGLVARSAAHQAHEQDQSWVRTSGTSSPSAPCTRAYPSSGARTGPHWRSTSCPRRECGQLLEKAQRRHS